jgi:hypothetical protein
MSIKGQGQPKSAHTPPVCLVSHKEHSVNYIIHRTLVFACTYKEQLDYVPENPGMISPLG